MKLWECVLLGGLALAAWSQGTARAAAEATADESQLTVITATRLTYDYKQRYALFEENVVVTDPELNLQADRLTVSFDADGKATLIKAEGRVLLSQQDKSAQAGLATYDIASGKIVLAGHPRVARGNDVLTGDIITFWRDQNRMICTPQARLVIHPDQGGTRDKLLGD